MEPVGTANRETIEAWNGVLYDRFVAFKHIVTTGLGIHGDAALAKHPPRPGERVLDVGCGFGDMSLQLGELVGPEGSVLGIDCAERFVQSSAEDAAAAGAANVSFEVADVEAETIEGEFDAAYARFGTMFFANPVNAMRNIRSALRPSGRLCMVVWRRKLDNDWMHRAEVTVEQFVQEPEEHDEPTCGPGPFSMANADTVSDIALAAGFENVTLDRCDIEIKIGDDLDKAVALMMALGPAGEIIRTAGEEADRLRPQITAALHEALAPFVGPDGVRAASSTWAVTATAPEAPAA